MSTTEEQIGFWMVYLKCNGWMYTRRNLFAVRGTREDVEMVVRTLERDGKNNGSKQDIETLYEPLVYFDGFDHFKTERDARLERIREEVMATDVFNSFIPSK